MLTDYLILTGSALNYYGAVTGLLNIFHRSQKIVQTGEVIKQQMFITGTAATFGSIYLYVFLRPQYIIPFLGFGAFLKYWAFLSALVAYKHHNLPRTEFVRFGISNGLVGTLLWVAFVVRAMHEA